MALPGAYVPLGQVPHAVDAAVLEYIPFGHPTQLPYPALGL
jgi:hypothetical protein